MMEESLRCYFEELEDGSLFVCLDGRFTAHELSDILSEMDKRRAKYILS
jgi:hypothetical protein